MRFRTLAPGLLLLAIILFSTSPAHAIILSIENDLLAEEDGNTLLVEKLVTVEAPKDKVQLKILPGKTALLSRGNVTFFWVVRPFERFKLKYEIICPPHDPNAEPVKETITLRNIHENKLPGGCKVARRGHFSRFGGMKWEVE